MPMRKVNIMEDQPRVAAYCQNQRELEIAVSVENNSSLETVAWPSTLCARQSTPCLTNERLPHQPAARTACKQRNRLFTLVQRPPVACPGLVCACLF